MSEVTVVGGGLAGLIAAIACSEAGGQVRLFEAHAELGGRARTSTGPFHANLGPHALYCDGPLWGWLSDRALLPPYARPPLAGVRFRHAGRVHRLPPPTTMIAAARLRFRPPPADRSFHAWAASIVGDEHAKRLGNAAGVFCFHHDPGALSAAFVWPRAIRVLFSPPPAARYPLGGWSALVERLARRAEELGVQIETKARVTELPPAPTILAVELDDAARLLTDPDLTWPGATTLCMDLGLESRRGDPFIVADFDEAGWVERFTAADRSLAPSGHELVQAQLPVRPSEDPAEARTRMEALLDAALPGWSERTAWRRVQVMHKRTGAVDPPGTTWADRPAVDRGNGVFLIGDAVAAPGLLSEVGGASALEAARRALAFDAGDEARDAAPPDCPQRRSPHLGPRLTAFGATGMSIAVPRRRSRR